MSALTFLQYVNRVIGVLFFVCYFYQMLYLPVALTIRKKERREAPLRRYAILISARNEEAVIAKLLESIQAQDYPAELITTFVVADNCTDNTAQAAREAGAEV